MGTYGDQGIVISGKQTKWEQTYDLDRPMKLIYLPRHIVTLFVWHFFTMMILVMISVAHFFTIFDIRRRTKLLVRIDILRFALYTRICVREI